jgi:hypothetical protein
MQRRNFLLSATALSITSMGTTLAQAQVGCVPDTGVAGIDVVKEIRALRIPTGPYAGGYEMAPNGRLNWYFTNLGLLPIVQFLNVSDLDTLVKGYLDFYLRCLTPADTIDDINFPLGRVDPSSFTKIASDSDDAYAATFVSLVVRYVRASQNWAWWEINKARIKSVAYRNLALTAKATGVTSVFQAPRSQTNSSGYLMDNCEGYRGLVDLASLLRDRGESVDANYFNLLASNAASGMRSQTFNVAAGAFTPSDAHPVPISNFYPGTTCQIYAQAFGVSELASQFDAGWAYLNKTTPGWEDGHCDPYPWAILGTVAAMRGQVALAKAQQVSIEKKFSVSRALVTINELGFYQRTKSILAGNPAV